jgi:hypothetical protein
LIALSAPTPFVTNSAPRPFSRAVRRIGRIQLAALADPLQRASVLELLQQFEIVVAGNAKQVPDAGLLEAA